MRTRWISLVILLVFTFGCAPSPANEQDVDREPSTPLAPPSEGDTLVMTPTTPVDAGLQNLIEKAKEDLAQRLNAALTQVLLIEAKAVVWPDASLGCPQPGMRYKQVPEDGALIVLQVNGINYEYHSGGNRGPFLCQKTSKEPSPPPPINLLNLTPPGPGAPTPDNGIPPGEKK